MKTLDLIMFLNDVKKIRGQDTETNQILSHVKFSDEFDKEGLTDFKKEYLENKNIKIKQEIRYLRDNYLSSLEGPEKEYLWALVKHYDIQDIPRELSEEELKVLDTTINNIDMSVRLYYGLNSYFSSSISNYLEYMDNEKQIHLGDIVKLKKEDISRKINSDKKYLDEKSQIELREVIASFGFELGDNINYVKPEDRKK